MKPEAAAASDPAIAPGCAIAAAAIRPRRGAVRPLAVMACVGAATPLPQSHHPASRSSTGGGGGAAVEQEMKLPLPDVKKVKELLTVVEQHPLGMLLLTVLVGVAGYFWRK